MSSDANQIDLCQSEHSSECSKVQNVPEFRMFIRPRPTRCSTRLKKPLKKPKVSHVNLDSDEEKEDSSDDEDSEDETEEEEEDSEQTLSNVMKLVKASSKKDKELTKKILQRRKEIATEAMPLSEEKTSEEEDESEEEGSEETTQEEEEEEKASSKTYGKGKDIAKVSAVIRAQRAEKIALRPMSRTKYFEFESLETKGWNLKKFTDPQGWTNFVSLQEHTYEDLVREFYTNLSVKQKKNENENYLISSVKGVQITITQDFLSEALNIPNEGNKLFSFLWYNDARVDRNQLIIKYTKENNTFNSTNLEDVPKILHNMVRHTLVPKCGSFDVVSDMDLCIIYHLITKTKLNLWFLIIQHMIDSCLAVKQSVAGLPYGMHLTSIFQKANIPFEGEKRKLDFMKFTSKTLGQLRITTSNMPTFTTSGISGSAKRLSNQNVQKTRKKRKVEEIRVVSPKNTISKLAKEIVQEGSFQYKALLREDDAQKVDDASSQEEAEIAKEATKVHEVKPQAAKENSFDQDKRVEENTEFDAQNVDDDTQEMAEFLVSNMSIEEAVQEEQMDFSTRFDLNVEDINTDFNEVFLEDKETAQIVQETSATQNVEANGAQDVEMSAAQNVEDVQ
ncbi:hypothetical protein MTR_0611s0030, partial [Medicago truncatula]